MFIVVDEGEGEGVRMTGGLSFFICICCAFAVVVRVKDSLSKLRQSKDSNIKRHYGQTGSDVDFAAFPNNKPSSTVIFYRERLSQSFSYPLLFAVR